MFFGFGDEIFSRKQIRYVCRGLKNINSDVILCIEFTLLPLFFCCTTGAEYRSFLHPRNKIPSGKMSVEVVSVKSAAFSLFGTYYISNLQYHQGWE